MTKRFPEKIRRIWKSEGFKVIDMRIRPIDNMHIEWRIVGEVMEG